VSNVGDREIGQSGDRRSLLNEPLDSRKLDPYPIGQGLFALSPTLDQWNVANIYRHVVARRQGSPA
jgi:hypothetical protein